MEIVTVNCRQKKDEYGTKQILTMNQVIETIVESSIRLMVCCLSHTTITRLFMKYYRRRQNV